jgi:hypothetical protein
MQAAKAAPTSKRNLLLCFDAFGTLFAPNTPIPTAYARAAARHGIKVDASADGSAAVAAQFKRAFREESVRNPNYGKASGLGADKWWGNVRLAPLPLCKQSYLCCCDEPDDGTDETRLSVIRSARGSSQARRCHRR